MRGTYPAQLADLVPDVLPKLPVDLYNAKPSLYHRDAEGYLLYSTGPNGTDDGGSNADWGGIAAGRDPDDFPEAEAEKLRATIPAGADDIAIRVPVVPRHIELPSRTAPPRTTPQ